MLLSYILKLSLAAICAPTVLLAANGVAPGATHSAIAQMTGQHVVISPKFERSNGKLLITFGGTSSKPDELKALQNVAAEQGYHVLGIDYPNKVISTICRNSEDRECFNKFRSEIILGRPVSSVTEVDENNCILNRIHRLLQYLAHEDRDGMWSQFLDGSEVRWSSVVVAGHSQGSGHAAYIAKLFAVRRVIVLAGPQDVASWGAASWLTEAGKTDPKNYFALLHEKDPFDSRMQLTAVRDLMSDQQAAVARIDREVPELTQAQIFISNADVINPHMAVVSSYFEKVWAHMLRFDNPQVSELITDGENL